MNGIAIVELATSAPLFFDSYEHSRTTGSFILVDPLSNATVGAGMIQEDLSEPQSVAFEEGIRTSGIGRAAVTSQERIVRHGHRPAIFLLRERDSLAESADRALFESGFEAILLYGDSFASQSLAATLSLLWSAGLIVLLVSDKPSQETRRTLEAVAADSIFDLSHEELPVNRKNVIAQVLTCAQQLRVPIAQKFQERPD